VTTVEKIEHRPTAAIMAALRERGWVFTGSKFPGNAIFAHPLSNTELPTPDYMRGSRSWPFETYHVHRQITFNYEGKRIQAIWRRICRAPWVNADDRRLSFKAAEAFIREEWTP
jgi:hypothetical protein